MSEESKTTSPVDKVWDVVMVGAGPASLSSAIYTSREDLSTLIIEKGVIGGLAAITEHIDNYPGFTDGVKGEKLSTELEGQAKRFGTEFMLDEVQSIREEDGLRVLKTYTGDIRARAVLIGTGSDYKKLKVPGEEEFYGRGVHYCATCDGAFYRDKKLVVVGSGNSSAQESLFLTRFATEIEILIRGDHWKASEILIKEVEAHPKIKVRFNTSTKEIIGKDNKVTKVLAHDKKADKDVEIDTDGVFVFVGLIPNTGFLKDTAVELDEFGFLKTDSDLKTGVNGVFAAGDVRSGATMQIASASGEGATAAMKIREFLEDKEVVW